MDPQHQPCPQLLVLPWLPKNSWTGSCPLFVSVCVVHFHWWHYSSTEEDGSIHSWIGSLRNVQWYNCVPHLNVLCQHIVTLSKRPSSTACLSTSTGVCQNRAWWCLNWRRWVAHLRVRSGWVSISQSQSNHLSSGLKKVHQITINITSKAVEHRQVFFICASQKRSSPDGKWVVAPKLQAPIRPKGELARSIGPPCDHHGHLDFTAFAKHRQNYLGSNWGLTLINWQQSPVAIYETWSY